MANAREHIPSQEMSSPVMRDKIADVASIAGGILQQRNPLPALAASNKRSLQAHRQFQNQYQ